ncbi:MAG: hypothetical protein ACKOYM_04955, partial [Actinomycetes bacterium]
MHENEQTQHPRPGGSWPLAEQRVAVTVHCNADHAELLADQCFVLGASAVGERDLPGGRVQLTADFPSDQVEAVLATLPGAQRTAVDSTVAAPWRDHI